MWVVIDHLSGSRRGQRDELDLADRIVLGRHPDCDVCFDTRRDLEASVRHAELRVEGDDVVLRDIGSSNGTYVEGERVHAVALGAGDTTEVEFGARGPRLRIWWHPTDDPSAVPPLPTGPAERRRILVIAAGIAVLAALLLLIRAIL